MQSLRHGEIGLAGPGRANAKDNLVVAHGLNIGDLAACLGKHGRLFGGAGQFQSQNGGCGGGIVMAGEHAFRDEADHRGCDLAALAAQPFELGEDLARRAHSGRVRAFNAHPGIARGDLRLRAGGDDSQAAEIVPDELLQKLRGLVSEGLDGHLLDQ